MIRVSPGGDRKSDFFGVRLIKRVTAVWSESNLIHIKFLLTVPTQMLETA